MANITSKGSSIETAVFELLSACPLRFETHAADLPGKPDIAFRDVKLAVFLDGGFWHGYRFSEWKDKLKPYWKNKISNNIKRERRNRKLLRESGWIVLRSWQREIKSDRFLVLLEILSAYFELKIAHQN